MIRVMVALVLLVTPLLAEHEFDSLVRGMESQYGTKRTYIPFLGFANFLVKVVRPAGTKDFKLAVFENIDSSRHPSPEELDATCLARGWKPFVRVVSNRKGERVQIYARQANRDQELLVNTLERDEAVIVRVRVNPETMSRWVNSPLGMCKSNGWR